MASNLRVDTILPSTGTSLGIGTASGTINFLGNSNITTTGTISAASLSITGSLGIGGTLTYEDVTNIDSVGVITARDGLRVTGIATISGDVSIADKIIHTGDTNTAIRFPGADQFSIETAGSQRLLTRADGRIQITSGNFEVIGGEGANAEFRLTADEGDDGADYWRFQSNASTNNLNIATYASGAWVDKVSIPSAGGIELKTDGKGIQYPTTQTPSNANTARVGISSEMRYYETGTFIPGLSSTVMNSLQNAAFTDNSYTRRIGRYVRVGHLVFVNLEILMAGTVTYNSGSTSSAPVCIVGCTPFYYAYAQRYDVSGQPDYIPCSISYSGSGLDNDTLYAVLRRDFPAQARVEITKPGTGGSRQYNSTNFGEVFPANSHIAVSFCYPIDTSNADY